MNVPIFSRSAIDIHSHFDHGAPGETSDPMFEGISLSAMDFVLEENSRFDIKETAFSTYSSVQCSDYIEAENDYLEKLSEENEGVYQWVVVHPLVPGTFEQAERLLKKAKVLGIKIHSPLHKYDILEHGDKIFSFADRMGATVLMHPDRIEDMVSFADRYPNMKLIIAHIGSRAHIDAIKNAKHGNIYTDTSGCLSALNNVIEYATETVGSEKLLFGTDAYSIPFQYCRIALARISNEDKENILFKNAIRLFPKAFAR